MFKSPRTVSRLGSFKPYSRQTARFFFGSGAFGCSKATKKYAKMAAFFPGIAASKNGSFQFQSFQFGSAQLLVAVGMDCASMLLSEWLPRVATLHVRSWWVLTWRDGRRCRERHWRSCPRRVASVDHKKRQRIKKRFYGWSVCTRNLESISIISCKEIQIW